MKGKGRMSAQRNGEQVSGYRLMEEEADSIVVGVFFLIWQMCWGAVSIIISQTFTVLSYEGWPPEMFALLFHHSLCLQPYKTAIQVPAGGRTILYNTHIIKRTKRCTVFLNCLCCVVWACASLVTPDCICTYFPTQSSYCLFRLFQWWNMLLMKP